MLIVVALLSYVPIYFMVNNALRTGPEMQVSPLALVTSPKWENFSFAWEASGYAYPRTFLIVGVSVLGIAITDRKSVV